MKRSGLRFLIGLIGVSVISLASCTPAEGDVVGTWIECSKKYIKGTDNEIQYGIYIFYENSQFEGYNIPLTFIGSSSHERVAVSGTWELDASSDIFNVSRIVMSYDPISDSTIGFDGALYMSSDLKLLFHGMGGDRILFSQDTNCE